MHVDGVTGVRNMEIDMRHSFFLMTAVTILAFPSGQASAETTQVSRHCTDTRVQCADLKTGTTRTCVTRTCKFDDGSSSTSTWVELIKDPGNKGTKPRNRAGVAPAPPTAGLKQRGGGRDLGVLTTPTSGLR
jgi:hypothetical protein